MASLEATQQSQGRKASKDVRRQQLIDATIQVLAERGYASLTVADVAKAAGLSVGIINFHFESKERLLAASLAYLADEYARNWKAAKAAAGAQAADQLEAVLMADFDDTVFTPTKLAAWIGFWGETQGRPTYQEHCAAYDAEHAEALRQLCAQIIAEGSYGHEPVAITRGLEAMGEGLWLGVVTANAGIEAHVTAAEARRTIRVCLAALFPKHFRESHPMSFTLSAEAARWRDTARAFVTRELQPLEIEAEMNEGRIPDAARHAHERWAIDTGLTVMDTPKALGGLALPILTQVAIVEQFGRVTNALGWCYGEAQGWMFEACNDDQLTRYILPITRGEVHLCYAITEENVGSDPAAVEATAERHGNSYVINAEKWHVTSFNHANHMVVQARIKGGEHNGAHCLFFCPIDAPGVAIKRSPLYAHTYDHHHPIVTFTNVKVPVADRIGQEGDGMGFTHAWFRRERLMIAARCCGAMSRLIEEASEFAKTRVVSGQAIANYQMIQAMLADCVTDLHASRLMTYEAADAHDRGEDLKSLHARCSLAKLFASEAAFRVADRAVQIFGGRGYMRENVAERFLREVRVDRIWEGTSEIQRLIIARSLLKRGLEATIGCS